MNPLPVAPAYRLAERAEEQRWLVDGLWSEEAVGIIGGEPKCCKLSGDNQHGCRVASAKNAPQADCRCLTSDAPGSGDRSRRGHGGKRNLFAPVAGRLLVGLSEREPSKAPMPRLRLEPPQSSPVAA